MFISHRVTEQRAGKENQAKRSEQSGHTHGGEQAQTLSNAHTVLGAQCFRACVCMHVRVCTCVHMCLRA